MAAVHDFLSTAAKRATEDAVLPLDEGFVDHQLHVIVYLERVGGCLSLFAVCLIFVAYWLVPRTRNVQNTFIVFASVSNIGASIASIIALDGLQAGKKTALCQAQSFLFEMFMQSDPWWSLAMAVNVFLVFYFRTSPDSFRRWWWLYCIICYGGPFVIALTLLFLRQEGRGPVYGGATIWCWVDREWDDVRIYTYYMLIWICIAGSLFFYFLVGYHVFHTRNQLHSLSTSKNRDGGTMQEVPRVALPSPAPDGFYGTAVTEIQVTHSRAAAQPSLPPPPKRSYHPTVSHVSFEDADGEPPNPTTRTYYSSVTSTSQPRPPAGARASPVTRSRRAVRKTMSKFWVGDPVKRAYLRTSFLFALSVLVTWIPSSLNRIHSWLQGESPFEYHVATAAVLPLQGLWNAVIFFVTSSAALRAWWRECVGGKGWESSALDDESAGERTAGVAGQRRGGRGSPGELDSDLDDDSGLAGSDVELRRFDDMPKSSGSTS